jgi:hypothetical protein
MAVGRRHSERAVVENEPDFGRASDLCHRVARILKYMCRRYRLIRTLGEPKISRQSMTAIAIADWWQGSDVEPRYTEKVPAVIRSFRYLWMHVLTAVLQ